MRCACFCQVMPVLAVHRSLRALQAVFSPPHTYISIQVKLGRDPQQEFATWCAEVQMASCIIQRFNARINGEKTNSVIHNFSTRAPALMPMLSTP